MFSAILFAIAVAALAQFALYYWRAVLTGVASQPVTPRVLEAAHIAESNLCGADFERLAGLLALTPELRSGGDRLGLVRVYYAVLIKVDQLFGALSPAVALWSERERVLCARYTAVQVGRRLEVNLAQAASVRSC